MTGPDKAQNRGSRARKVLFASAATAAVLVLMELSFRGLGLFAPPPVFEEYEQEGRRMVRYNLNYSAPPFSARKPETVFRIMAAGGSSTLGFPYHPRSSFGLRLSRMLEYSTGMEIEFINLGAYAMGSRGVGRVVQEALAYEPDLLIVYSGHNEFIKLSESSALGKVRRALLRSRVAGVAAAGVGAAVGRAKLAVMKAMEADPEASAILPLPARMSGDDYRRALTVFEKNLREIARSANSRGVRLVLCTAASNLRGWPPERKVLPASVPEDDRQEVIRGEDKAWRALERGEYREALAIVREFQDKAPGYAPVSYIKGLVLAEYIVEQGAAAGRERKKEIRARALREFKKALSEEARTIGGHRAPPELNQVTRKVAAEEGVLFFDSAIFLERASYPAPGFDRFVDHVHPDLNAQQAIAEGLFELLKDKGIPVPENRFRPVLWQEEKFREEQGIDAGFLHKVFLGMGIYLGMRKEFPYTPCATSDTLDKAAAMDPDDPLPSLIKAAVLLHYGKSDEAAAIIQPLRDRHPHKLEKALDRYFTCAVDLRQGVFMARTWEDNPPLRGLLKSGLFKQEEENSAKQVRALDYFNVFLDLDQRGADISGWMEKLLGHRRALVRPGPVVVADPPAGLVLSAAGGSRLTGVSEGAQYELKSGGRLVAEGLNVEAAAYNILVLACSRRGEVSGPVRVMWQWPSAGGLEAAEARVEKVGREGREYTIRLSLLPRWIMAGRIDKLIVDPALVNGTFTLYSMRLEAREAD